LEVYHSTTFGVRALARNSLSLGIGLYLLLLGSGRTHATTGSQSQMLLGNPSQATAETNNHDHYLIQRPVAALDYSDTLRQPNWVSWHLTTNDLGSTTRSSSFFVDTTLPPNFYWVQTTDYSGSGYDRGHMCPSADRTDTVTHNEETFLMSNIIPQAPDNNQGIWANLETYCRGLATAGNEVLITSGPEGFGTNRTASTGQIPIASNVWKIVVVVPLGTGSTLDRITSTARVIAVNIPNLQGIRSDPWQNYITSVNVLQTNTGYTFFTALNPDLAAVLRARIDGAPPAAITSFTPQTGTSKTVVFMSGSNFTGVTAVKFCGLDATFTVDSATQITATVPTGATTGPISVITGGGLATSTTPFTINPQIETPPTLSITRLGHELILTWPGRTMDFELQQNSDLDPANWTAYNGTIIDNATNKIATITNTAGNQFFRLRLQ
jgi:endonuclease G